MSGAVAESLEEKARPGDRVKLIGNHRWAGHYAKYLYDGQFYESGQGYPVVRVENYESVGDKALVRDRGETFVLDPERQMRKA